ncbi:LVIVD repeat-containing protein [Chitinophaga sp. SYP-B3965]|uniref:LVIVD repeat-containing protein n=1 Tax=Chitinophaga sp. SYP-B3965 TaxID=2663120 RepID=UPI001565A4A1|nr:beta-propeller domain-containing protein [Chitinophaga sp. SYP-B3965]
MKKLYYLLFVLLIMISCTKDNAKSSDSFADGGKGGSLARFAIAGNYLYVVNQNALKVYDITDATAPVDKGVTQLPWGIETIFAYDQKLFVGSTNALFIFDITDPAKPKPESRVQHFRSCDPVVTQGTTAFVTLRGGNTCGGTLNALMVYDVKDVKNPVMKAQVELTGPYGLGVQDSALYVCDGAKGLGVFNIKDPYLPKVLEYINDGSIYYDVIPYNGILIAYVEGGVRFFDISKPQNPVALSALMN